MISFARSLKIPLWWNHNNLKKKQPKKLLEVFKLLNAQTQQKLNGEKQIESRIVSLDELEARPIKKGKAFRVVNLGRPIK